MGVLKSRKWRDWFLPAAAVLLVMLVIQCMLSRTGFPVIETTPEEGILDITGQDLSHQVLWFGSGLDFYPNELYTSADFAAGRVGEKAPPQTNPSDSAFGTHRLRIKAQPNQYYTLCGFSLDYACRVFVNGTEIAVFGQVAENADDFVPQVGYMTIPLFSGQTGEIEVILQYSNYVHRDGGYIQPLYLSTPQNMENFKAARNLVSLTLSGGLVMLALYFMLSAVMRRKVDFFCLAFCCFVMALRDQNFYNIHLLPPDLSWYVKYRVFILVVMLLPVSILLLLRCMYPQDTKRWPLWIYIGAVAVAAALICLLPTRDVVTVSTTVYYLSIPYLFYLLFGVGRHYVRQRRLLKTDVLVLAGFLILVAALLYDALLTGRSSEVTHYGTAAYGMLGFALLNATAINLQIQARETALAESRSRGRMLEQMNRMNIEFFRQVAHELKTPLTVISGYAQLTGMEVAANHLSRETPENLRVIQQEAQRLADMVTQLMRCSDSSQPQTMGPVQVDQLLDRVRAVTAPICLKNHNAVCIQAKDCPDVHGSGELLLQVLINLVSNASRSTQNGCVTIRAGADPAGGFVRFEVEDTGSGIAPEHLDRVFEKGFSASGSSGLGLAICREAVESQGGRIWAERTGPEGTVMAFTVREEEQG